VEVKVTQTKEIAKCPTMLELKQKSIFLEANPDSEDPIELEFTTTDGEEITIVPRTFNFKKNGHRIAGEKPEPDSCSISGHVKGQVPKLSAVIFVSPQREDTPKGEVTYIL
jgi:hypothetical protein